MKLPKNFKKQVHTGGVIGVLAGLFTFCMWVDTVESLNKWYKILIIVGIFLIELCIFTIIMKKEHK